MKARLRAAQGRIALYSRIGPRTKTEARMKEYISFDSHKHYTLMEREEITSGAARQCRIEHAPGAIVAALRGCAAGTAVAVEATGNWYWIISEIELAGLQPLLVHPRKAMLIMGLINKTDNSTCTGSIGSVCTLHSVVPSADCDLREQPPRGVELPAHRLKNRIGATAGTERGE
jgi:hypothetical protein